MKFFLACMPRSPIWPHSLWLADQNFICFLTISLLPHIHPSHPLW
jgi:hypothetical protein